MLILWGFTNFSGREVTKNNIYRKSPKKGGLDNLQGASPKNREEGVFQGGRGVDTSMHTMT